MEQEENSGCEDISFVPLTDVTYTNYSQANCHGALTTQYSVLVSKCYLHRASIIISGFVCIQCINNNDDAPISSRKIFTAADKVVAGLCIGLVGVPYIAFECEKCRVFLSTKNDL